MRLVQKLIIVCITLLFFQLPHFMDQYQHELIGHVKELQVLIVNLNKTAALTNKTLMQYIDKFLRSHDLDFSNQGKFMQGVLDRYDSLNQSLTSINSASIYTKPYYFFKNFDAAIGSSTMKAYTFGISFTKEAFFYGLFGFILAQIIIQSFKKLTSFRKTPNSGY